MNDLKIVITIDSKEHTLTMEEAKALYVQLDEVVRIPLFVENWPDKPIKVTCGSDNFMLSSQLEPWQS
ncbi:MAG: hypothetical protein IH937_03325 [Acidobacteria bacterium]|nr:hypothetical protein [Acidobacteriota bacterium]